MILVFAFVFLICGNCLVASEESCVQVTGSFVWCLVVIGHLWCSLIVSMILSWTVLWKSKLLEDGPQMLGSFCGSEGSKKLGFFGARYCGSQGFDFVGKCASREGAHTSLD